jgi:uncharacterized damage-inducible protein DinB
VDRSYIVENNLERERLRALVERLSDAELSHQMAAGWTVAGVLAHLAYWDALALYLINEWESGEAPSNRGWEPEDVEWINNAAKPLCLAMPPRAAAQLALQMAEETDRRVEGLSDEMLEKIIAVGPPFNLSRAIHRKEHLDDIERYL